MELKVGDSLVIEGYSKRVDGTYKVTGVDNGVVRGENDSVEFVASMDMVDKYMKKVNDNAPDRERFLRCIEELNNNIAEAYGLIDDIQLGLMNLVSEVLGIDISDGDEVD